MSYDIYFIRRDPGQSFEDALERTEDSYESGAPGLLTSVELEQWERIVPHARAILGEIEEFTGESERELSHHATGVQLSIFPGEISITVPYWHSDEDSVSVMEKVYALARAVEDETGLEGYDPQLGEPIRDAPRSAAHSTMGDVSHRLDSEEFRETGRIPASSQPAAPPPEPAPPATSTRRWWEFWKS